MKNKTELVAPCGVYCGVCPVYRADKENIEGLRKKIAVEFGVKREVVGCDGCRSDRVFLGGDDCGIKACTRAKGIEGCFACEDFPCVRVEGRPDFMRRVIIRAVPILKWCSIQDFLDQEEKRYRCSQCGTRLYIGARKCPKCGLAVGFEEG